jgi:hypothetical protein
VNIDDQKWAIRIRYRILKEVFALSKNLDTINYFKIDAIDLNTLAKTLGNKWNPHDTKLGTNSKLGTRNAV